MKKPYSPIPDIHQIERLKKYYDYNEETYTFTIPLHFAKASDIIDTQFDTTIPKIKDELLDIINEKCSDIPKGYHADYLLIIDDYEGYVPSVVLSCFNDLMNVHHYRYRLESQIRYSKIAFLFFAGMSFILLFVLGDLRGWWGDGTSLWERLVVFVLDVLGYVLIWESICHAAIHRPLEKDYKFISSKRFSSITLCKENKDNVLISESIEETINKGKTLRLEKVMSFFLLLSAIGLLVAAIFSGTHDIVNEISLYEQGMIEGFGIRLFLIIFESAVLIILGYNVYRLYMGDRRYIIPIGVLGCIAIGFLIYDYVLIIGKEGMIPVNLIAFILDIFIYTSFVLGYIFALIYIYKEKRLKE